MAIKGLKDLISKIRGNADMTEAQVEEELNKALPESWVPKSTFNEKAEELKSIKKTVEENAVLMKELTEKANLSDEYKSKISKLSADNEKAAAEFKAQIAKMRLDTALDKALSGAKAKNAGFVAKALDMSKIQLSDDGSLIGLNEQIAALKTSDPYLFDESTEDKGGKEKPFVMGGGRETPDADKDLIASMRRDAGLK